MTVLKSVMMGTSARSAGVGRLVRVGAMALVGLVALGGLSGCKNQAQQDEQARVMAENAQLKEQVAQQAQAQQALQSQLEQLQRDQANRTTTTTRDLAPPKDGGGGGDRAPRGDTVIEVAGDVAFSSGQAELTAAGKRELDGIARTINQKFASSRIRVEGYSDRHPIRKSKWGSNEALSLARAQAVERYLASKGISAGRMESVGMGSKKLKATDAASRRVEIVIIGG